MQIARIDGMEFIESLLDVETGEPVKPSLEVIRNTRLIPYLSAIMVGLEKTNKVTLRWEDIYDEDGDKVGGQLLAEIDEDDEEIMDLIRECSAQFDSAVAERFAQEKIEDE